MGLDALSEKKLLIFAGKGGVGKTTTASAMALRLAAAGKRTLLVTVDPAKRLEDSLGVPLDTDPREVRPRLYAAMLDPEQIIRQRIAHLAEGRKVIEHPLFRWVTNYLPGLNELMAIGRLNEIRHEDAYDIIVIDTAPTGHALSFLSAPRGIQELMGDTSVVRWVLRAYTLYQRFTRAGRGVAGFFGNKDEATREEIDIEAVFQRLAEEAKGIQEMLTDETRTSLVIVTLPERLPVEETIDLYDHAVTDIGIHIGAIVINKIQPDTLGRDEPAFLDFAKDREAQSAVAARLADHGYPASLAHAMIEATTFSDIRRRMNLLHVGDLEVRLGNVPKVLVPLFEEDVEGLDKLDKFSERLFDTPLAPAEAAQPEPT